MHSIPHKYNRYIWFILIFCFGVGYMMTKQSPDTLHSPLSVISLLCLALPVYTGMVYTYGIRSAFLLWCSIGLFGICIETIGIATGYPYGTFLYTNPLGGLLFGLAPWSLLLAWPPLVIGSWTITHTRTQIPYKRALYATTLLVLFDLILDPGAVALGFWSFLHTGTYYEVPYTNFLGWIFSGIVSVSILEKHTKRHITDNISTFTLSSGFLCSTALWTGVALGHRHTIPLIIGISLLFWITYNQRHILTK